jgi:hypothetical protein
MIYIRILTVYHDRFEEIYNTQKIMLNHFQLLIFPKYASELPEKYFPKAGGT